MITRVLAMGMCFVFVVAGANIAIKRKVMLLSIAQGRQGAVDAVFKAPKGEDAVFLLAIPNKTEINQPAFSGVVSLLDATSEKWKANYDNSNALICNWLHDDSLVTYILRSNDGRSSVSQYLKPGSNYVLRAEGESDTAISFWLLYHVKYWRTILRNE